MQTLINGRIQSVAPEESLYLKRYQESLARKYKIPFSFSKEDAVEIPDPSGETESMVIPSSEPIADSIDETSVGEQEQRSEEKYFGQDVVVKPIAYYSLDDSLKHALEDYKTQIARTVALVMTRRAKYGQKLATANDRKDVLGEYPEKNTTDEIVPAGTKTGPGLKVKLHYFTRPINNVMYRITIDEHKMGIGQTRRNTYMLVDIAVIFYRKNGIGLGKEIVLRSKVLRFRKRQPGPASSGVNLFT
jgi:hypothetical protein